MHVSSLIFQEQQRHGATGNSNVTIDYSIKDLHPYSGINYYRIKQIDFNGSIAYSSIKSVQISNTQALDFYIYPKPARDIINVKFNNSEKGNELFFYDILGRSISSIISVQKINATTSQVDISELKSGIYFIKTKEITRKFSVSK